MFGTRSNEPEIMDNLDFHDPVVFQTLKELDIINTWLGGNAVTLNALKKLHKEYNFKKRSSPLKIADLGCGSGYILRMIYDWAKKEGIEVELTGIDANVHITNYAKAQNSSYPEISFLPLDIFSEEFRLKKFDIVTCTLFVHHFDNNTLSSFFTQLKSQVSTAIILNDIHRHWMAYYSIKWLTILFSRSYMVKYDAKLSVLRAFKRRELESIFNNAGINNFLIQWKWAFRYCAILKP